MTLAGLFVGFWVANDVSTWATSVLHLQPVQVVMWDGAGAILIGVVGLFWAPVVQRWERDFRAYVFQRVARVSAASAVTATLGAIAGLAAAALLGGALAQLPEIGRMMPLVVSLVLGYAGMLGGLRLKDEFGSIEHFVGRRGARGAVAKVLDTSVIIDGRIADLCRTGFLEGPLVVPSFVLEELRHIADSSDALKRNRGRRGLDVLNQIQKELHVPVQVYEREVSDPLLEVDTKLLRLARYLGGKILTNDFNLNKVAELQGVDVLNINELANAVKPVVLPGEEMLVRVIKDGKESGQGVAYLDDGTMIVVDGGKKFIGDTVGVLVTSVLQTAAGRMIFAKPKPMEQSASAQ